MTNQSQNKPLRRAYAPKPKHFIIFIGLLASIAFVRSAIAQPEEENADVEQSIIEDASVPSETSDASVDSLEAGAEEASGGEEYLWKLGKNLFVSNCASCHHPENDGTGPALSGVRQRWIEDGDFDGKSGEEWLYAWIKNNKKVLESGHPYANALFKKWGGANMNLFAGLGDEEIDALLYYVDNSKQFEVGGSPTEESSEAAPEEGGIGQSFLNKYLRFIGVGLFFLVLILARVHTVLKRIELQKTGQPIPPNIPIWKSKKALAVIIPLLIFAGANSLMNSAIGVGRQQGYQPEQPIAYSHALHAGQMEIPCQYCHSAASKSKHSNIPSADVCMNCHMGAQANSENKGRSEIGKIYASLGWDPNVIGGGAYIPYPETVSESELDSIYRMYLAQDYSEEELTDEAILKELDENVNQVVAMYNSPIPWVRIHNLPDHVYFNHAQHVNVGNVECQSCHGPIQEMEVVYQWAPLSMGWCINCHRNAEIDQTNPYYEEHFENLSEEATVEDIGGTECQKCHY